MAWSSIREAQSALKKMVNLDTGNMILQEEVSNVFCVRRHVDNGPAPAPIRARNTVQPPLGKCQGGSELSEIPSFYWQEANSTCERPSRRAAYDVWIVKMGRYEEWIQCLRSHGMPTTTR